MVVLKYIYFLCVGVKCVKNRKHWAYTLIPIYTVRLKVRIENRLQAWLFVNLTLMPG